MAYDPGAIEAALAAAVGDDPALIADLRIAFVESGLRALAQLHGARDAIEWRSAAARLDGLAASFSAVRLMALAKAAGEAPVRDVAVLRKLDRAIARL